MTNTIYIHQPEKAFSFTRLPNFLFEAPTFKPLSNEAKVLYAFILRRTELSRKNGWADDCGRIFLYYPICEVVDLLHCGRQKAVNTLRELQYAGLIETAPLKYENRTVYRNTKIKMIYLYPFHSYRIRDNSGGIFPAENPG